MNSFNKRNKTGPKLNPPTSRTYAFRPSRTNGWSWPPHPYQIACWMSYLYCATVVLGILIPLLPTHWLPAGYIWFGIVFTCHVVFHLIAASIDPADDNVRAKSYKKTRTVFDRSRHKHVIENRHCFLCEVDVGLKSKHCSRCNKCVAVFDHHCKWLNNCVGGRNYWYFLSSIISALLGALVIVSISTFVLIGYSADANLLRSNPKFALINDTKTWLAFLPHLPVHTTTAAILTITVITNGLSLTAVVLLGQLLCFHFYLLWNRLSTYEYIVRQRQRRMSKVSPIDDVEELPSRSIQNIESTRSFGYTNNGIHFEATSLTGTTSEYRQDDDLKLPTFKIENEFLPTISAHLQQARVKKSSQLRKKRKRKVSASVNNDKASTSTTKLPSAPPLSQPDLTAAFRSSGLPLQAFPPMVTLPSLLVSGINLVQAAGPPAEYHSDSAESMNEIPVVQTRLGSAAVVKHTKTTFHSTKDNFENSLQTLIPKQQCDEEPVPSSAVRPILRKSVKKSEGLDPKVELLHSVPPVNVSHKNGKLPLPELLHSPRSGSVNQKLSS
ncbi:palmitoyltransferase ZDHHC1 [Pristis pectinata]|uniref:palmitoyltransferase ZDHHC1 n=1 Tax=Pristis pectinata TaxID=685728 RepID=UPI00223D7966|nr:palmitoyltransferase ZDHHC1 [Pristis pectinata]XP_051884635.1 palmitoyltransferase ZDHHC1 [Pristis pectinata]